MHSKSGTACSSGAHECIPSFKCIVNQELLALPEHRSVSLVLSGVLIAHYLVCPFLFPFAIVLSLLLDVTKVE